MVKIQLKLECQKLQKKGLHVFLNHHHKKKHILSKVQLKNAFVTGVAFNIELQSRKINLPQRQ